MVKLIAHTQFKRINPEIINRFVSISWGHLEDWTWKIKHYSQDPNFRLTRGVPNSDPAREFLRKTGFDVPSSEDVLHIRRERPTAQESGGKNTLFQAAVSTILP